MNSKKDELHPITKALIIASILTGIFMAVIMIGEWSNPTLPAISWRMEWTHTLEENVSKRCANLLKSFEQQKLCMQDEMVAYYDLQCDYGLMPHIVNDIKEECEEMTLNHGSLPIFTLQKECTELKSTQYKLEHNIIE